MFLVLSDPAIYEFENAPPVSEAWLVDRFARLEAGRSKDGEQTWLNWVIRLPSGELAGYVQSTVLASGMAYVAYELASAHWRKGIGSAAVRVMMQELSSRYGVNTFIAVLKSQNYRSIGLLQKLEFVAASEEVLSIVAPEPDERVMMKAQSPEAAL
ncbi:MAG: N-acetyltransferase [Burkholderiales bacterium]|nr:MAG: N-acetyltransferase [Betaproteobacteria bacterium]TAG84029.1 MAG: N-acetyltransferase [Burkholderiales bacterium]